MKQQEGYGDPTAISYAAAQVQHMSAPQHNAGMDNFPGHLHSFTAREDHPYKSSKLEEQWHWDREAPRALNQMPSHSYSEGQGANGARSYYQGQVQDPKLGFENQSNKESKALPYDQEMEIGYDNNPSLLNFEALERKFLDEIKNLIKKQTDAEDAEITRHREKITEINTRYQENLSELRSRHANRREEFLQKDSEARRSQYQQGGTSQYTDIALQEVHRYGGPVPAATGEALRAYGPSQLEPYRDQPPYIGTARQTGRGGRVPYPPGRVYNTDPRFY